MTFAKTDKRQPERPLASRHKWSAPSFWPAVLFVALAVGLSGCPALMVGSLVSLGYEGYEYLKTGTLPGVPAQVTSKKPTPQASPAANDIE